MRFFSRNQIVELSILSSIAALLIGCFVYLTYKTERKRQLPSMAYIAVRQTQRHVALIVASNPSATRDELIALVRQAIDDAEKSNIRSTSEPCVHDIFARGKDAREVLFGLPRGTSEIEVRKLRRLPLTIYYLPECIFVLSVGPDGIKSVEPSDVEFRDGRLRVDPEKTYDPTNGTNSPGDIFNYVPLAG